MFQTAPSAIVRAMSTSWRTATAAAISLLVTSTAAITSDYARANADGSSARFGIQAPPAGCVPAHSDELAPGTDAASVCDGQRVRLPSASGDVYVETWLPAAAPGGPAPPGRIPNILIMTPYVTFDRGLRAQDYVARFVEHFVPRGYAVAVGHLPGSASSDGCLGMGDPLEVAATSMTIDFLGRRAPWSGSKANVGMIGLSNDGSTAVAAASLGDPVLVAALKAIVAVAPPTSAYEYVAWNGVPTGTAAGAAATYAAVSTLPGDGHERRTFGCADDNAAAGAAVDVDGRYGPYWDEREYRRGASNVRAATLLFQGLKDTNVYPSHTVGWFDRLPPGTPRKIVVGPWVHGWPDRATPADTTIEAWGNDLPAPLSEVTHAKDAGPDWLAMTDAWFDRYLMGRDTEVAAWPTAQVGSSSGTWRSARDWPATGDAPGQLPLRIAADGTTTTFAEAGPGAVFSLPAGDGIHLTGQPMLDLWVQVEGRNPGRARLGVTVEARAADGQVVDAVATYGARAVSQRAPFGTDGYFHQDRLDAVESGRTMRVVVPLMPADVIVPAGGSLRVTIAGMTSGSAPPTVPSGSGSEITIRHDCTYRSALRFLDAAAASNPGPTTTTNVAAAPTAARAPALDTGCDGPALDPDDVRTGRR